MTTSLLFLNKSQINWLCFRDNFIFVDVGEIRIRADLKKNDERKISESNIKEEIKPANHALIFSYLQNILKVIEK